VLVLAVALVVGFAVTTRFVTRPTRLPRWWCRAPTVIWNPRHDGGHSIYRPTDVSRKTADRQRAGAIGRVSVPCIHAQAGKWFATRGSAIHAEVGPSSARHDPDMAGRLDLDLYNVLLGFGWLRERAELVRATSDPGFLLRARRALLPVPRVDRPPAPPRDVLPPYRPRRIAALRGSRVALIAGGGGGACVALIGVRRVFEEAGIEPELITSCSGGRSGARCGPRP
jgi:hypothetical protein